MGRGQRRLKNGSVRPRNLLVNPKRRVMGIDCLFSTNTVTAVNHQIRTRAQKTAAFTNVADAHGGGETEELAHAVVDEVALSNVDRRLPLSLLSGRASHNNMRRSHLLW
jgi:hypothetical protein